MRLLFHPRSRRVCPGTNLKVDWHHPILNGLFFLKLLNNKLADPSFDADYGLIGTTPSIGVGTKIGASQSGSGLTGSANTSALLWGQSYLSVPQTAGSCFAFTTFGFAPTDSVAHYMFQLTNLGTIEFSLTKYSDNNWYFGWNVSGNDRRATGAASGSFSAGDTTVVGGTWSSAGTKLWVNGKNARTNVTAPTTTDTGVANVQFAIGNSVTSSNTQSWDANALGTMHWLAFWSRELSDSEIVFLHNNPMAFLLPFNEMSILQAQAAPPVTSVFRRSASRIGTRIGTRQTWAG